jgi:hypothetical protein
MISTIPAKMIFADNSFNVVSVVCGVNLGKNLKHYHLYLQDNYLY